MTSEPAPSVGVDAPPPTSHLKPCANCGAPMHGPFCYACGQPEKGMIRHLASVMADVADTIFNVDSRIFRSIVPLYLRPGYLTNEYFHGRRTRYVTPFRLFFFLSIISFFAIQISINASSTNFELVDDGDTGGVQKAQTADEVDQRMHAALDKLAAAQKAAELPPAASAKLAIAESDVRTKAAERLAFLKRRQEAAARGEKLPPDPVSEDDDLGTISFDGKAWDPHTHPIAVAWLPAFANAKLNEMAQHGKDNLFAAKKNPGQAIARLFAVLPQTLFVLMPLFAVLLKIVYIFKRRLYMEHLMVALHSHAFIFMSLLLLTIDQFLIGWCAGSAAWALPLLKLLRAAMWTWLPIYLFLMQKKVYRQGWIMTTFKYGVVGICYVVILSLGLTAAAIASLTIT